VALKSVPLKSCEPAKVWAVVAEFAGKNSGVAEMVKPYAAVLVAAPKGVVTLIFRVPLPSAR